MIRAFFLIFTVLLTSEAIATPAHPGGMTPLASKGVLVADFTQHRTLQGVSRPLLSRGKVILWQGHGLIWQTQTPFPSILVLTPTGTYHVKQGQLVVNPGPQQQNFFALMSKALSGQLEDVPGFELTSSLGASGPWERTLTPYRSDLARIFNSITLSGDTYLRQITLERAQGDRDEIDFSNHQIVEESSLEMILTDDQKRWLSDG